MISTSFALVCFAGTLFYGLLNGNDGFSIMLSALLVGLIAWIVGGVIGAVMLRSVNEHIERHRENNPIPTETPEPEDQTDPATMAAG